jgi:Protein of unknown function (DUF2865)
MERLGDGRRKLHRAGVLKVSKLGKAQVRRSASSAMAAMGAVWLGLWADPLQAQVPAVCQQIQAQIARLDSAATSGGNRRFAQLASRQRAEIATAQRQFQAGGCGGFFQNGQCAALGQHIGRMQANLAQLEAQASGGGAMNSAQRAQLMAAYDANGCRGGGGGRWAGRTYSTEDRPQTAYQDRGGGGFAGFIEQLFGGGRRDSWREDPAFNESSPSDQVPGMGGEDGEQRPRGTGYRAVCVRLCDGAFFPMTSAPRPGAGVDDEEMCQVQCPGTEVALFHMRDDRIENAVSPSGRTYSSLPNALRFRTRFDSACTCRPPNGSWAATFADRVDPTLRPGDQVVSAEQARLLSMPAAQRANARDEIAAEQRARRETDRQSRIEAARARGGAPATIGLDGSIRPSGSPSPAEMRAGERAPAARPAETPAQSDTARDGERRPVRVIGPLPRAEAPRAPSGG